MGNRSRFQLGTGLTEYALPLALVTVSLVAIATVTLPEVLHGFVNDSVNGNGAANNLVQPLGSPTLGRDALTQFDPNTTKNYLESLTMRCSQAHPICRPVSGDERLETAGGLGNEQLFLRQFQTILGAIASQLPDTEEGNNLKQKLRELSNETYALSDQYTQLSQALRQPGTSQEALNEIIKTINGGTITIVDSSTTPPQSVTVTGRQENTLVQKIRILKNAISQNPAFQNIEGAGAAFTAMFNALEVKALSYSAMKTPGDLAADVAHLTQKTDKTSHDLKELNRWKGLLSLMNNQRLEGSTLVSQSILNSATANVFNGTATTGNWRVVSFEKLADLFASDEPPSTGLDPVLPETTPGDTTAITQDVEQTQDVANITCQHGDGVTQEGACVPQG